MGKQLIPLGCAVAQSRIYIMSNGMASESEHTLTAWLAQLSSGVGLALSFTVAPTISRPPKKISL